MRFFLISSCSSKVEKLTKLTLKWYGRDLGRLLRCGVLTSPIFDWRYLGNFAIHFPTIIIKHSKFKEISTIFENTWSTSIFWFLFLPHHKICLFVCRHHNCIVATITFIYYKGLLLRNWVENIFKHTDFDSSDRSSLRYRVPQLVRTANSNITIKQTMQLKLSPDSAT